MEIKSIQDIINETQSALNLKDYELAYKIAKENIDLNKEYKEGEYVFKNMLEEFLFKVHIKKEITRKYPLILDYSTLYSTYGEILLKFERIEEAEKSFNLSINYNPTNVSGLFGLSKIKKYTNKWEDYKNLTLETFKFAYTPKDLAKSFRNLAIYYFKEYDLKNKEEDKKIGSYLITLSKKYSDEEEPKDIVIEEIEDYLKSKGLPYGPAIEIITICKSLGFQLDEAKKVVPALHYFKIVYDLTKDENIKLTIDDLNEKIEKRLNE